MLPSHRRVTPGKCARASDDIFCGQQTFMWSTDICVDKTLIHIK